MSKLPAPRIVEVSEIIDGWSDEQRLNFAYFCVGKDPGLIDEYDEFLREIERRQAARDNA